jgi:hypothetical protein
MTTEPTARKPTAGQRVDPAPAWRPPALLRHLIRAAVVGLVAVAAYCAYSVHRYVTETVPNAYAAEWVGGIVVDHLRQNGDRWPRSWDDLRPVYEQHASQSGQPWSFEELQSRVVIRWDVDVERLRREGNPDGNRHYPVISLRDGSTTHWVGFEPNEMVYRYLIEQEGSKDGSDEREITD